MLYEDHRKLLSSNAGGPAGRAQLDEQTRLIREGRWNDAMELEYEDMRRVAAERGAPGIYDDAINEHRDKFGRPPTPCPA